MPTTNRVGGNAWVAFEELIVDTGAYASGDLVGGKITIGPIEPESFANGVLIQSVIITDLDKQSVNLDVVFFDGDPVNTTFTDNAAFDPDDNDLEDFCAGVVAITDWKDFNDNSIGQGLVLAMPIIPADSRNFYAAIVARGAPTYAASGLGIRLHMLAL